MKKQIVILLESTVMLFIMFACGSGPLEIVAGGNNQVILHALNLIPNFRETDF